MNLCHIGDCREVMRRLIAEGVRVQMCVTSPPYWGLRDYGTAQWEGGEDGCDHTAAKKKSRYDYSLATSPIQDGTRTGTDAPRYFDECPTCNARRIDQQLGLESTPAAYVASMVEVFSLVRELLADDGTLWLNLGDSYAAGKQGQDSFGDATSGLNNGRSGVGNKTGEKMATRQRKPPDGLKPKDLCGIPWRVAFALQADGWYLRQDIIWAKPNPMPESVTDRCTKAHEYLFLLAKRERYYYDAAAIAEPGVGRETYFGSDQYSIGSGRNDSGSYNATPAATRNRRSVWTVPTAPYAEAHFATFPPALIEPCIMAGSRVNDVVLDPFMGSGTTGQVAQDLGRRWIGCELNEAYAKLQDRRTAQQAMVLA